jgi:hypothetical protein
MDWIKLMHRIRCQKSKARLYNSKKPSMTAILLISLRFNTIVTLHFFKFFIFSIKV